MALVAIRIGSTWRRPEEQAITTLTILFTSTGCRLPFLFLTRMILGSLAGVSVDMVTSTVALVLVFVGLTPAIGVLFAPKFISLFIIPPCLIYACISYSAF